MTIDALDAIAKTQTESRGSVAFEFADADLSSAPTTARMLDQLRLRTPLRPREYRPADLALSNWAALADCLLARARVLFALGQHGDALSAACEAQAIYKQEATRAPEPSALAALADSCHVLAKLSEFSGRLHEALSFLDQEAELRRRLSA